MKMSAVIFSETRNDAMSALTASRPIASLSFGGRYRLIDFVLSSIVNAGIADVGVITQRNYRSLMDHLGSCQEWDLDRKNGGLHFITPLSSGDHSSYSGKIDQLAAALDFLEETTSDYILLADPATVCNIDFRAVLDAHLASGADVTIVCDRAKRDRDEKYKLVMDVKDNRPSAVFVDIPPKAGQLESMGIYLVARELLIEKVRALTAQGLYHLDRDLILRSFNAGDLSLNVYEFTDIVLRNNTVGHYLKNNLSLSDPAVQASIFKKEAPVYTRVRDEVPTYYGADAVIEDCSVADGCVLNGTVIDSVIGRNVRIEKGATVKGSLILQNCVIEAGAYIENAIVDKNEVITGDVKLIGTANRPMIMGKGSTL